MFVTASRTALALESIVSPNYTIHTERMRQITCQFRNDHTDEVEQVIFPRTVVSQMVAITLVPSQDGKSKRNLISLYHKLKSSPRRNRRWQRNITQKNIEESINCNKKVSLYSLYLF